MNSRRKRRRRILALIAAAAVALVVGLIILAVVGVLRQRQSAPSAVPPSIVPPTSSGATHPHKPRPASQDSSCPDVQLISIPGTWESSLQDDPLNPVQFPKALLLNVTRPIREQFNSSRVETYTVPYTAQFHNPLSGDTQISYDQSRAEGTRAAVKAMTDMNVKCPLTGYVLVGFSQGAIIAGDIASDVGNGRGPVDDDLVLGVTLIADGRRQQGVGQEIGPNPPGEGAEIILHEVPVLSNLGLTMTGPRPGGFGDARRQDQRDLRPRRPDLRGPSGGIQPGESAQDAGHPGGRGRRAGARAVRHHPVLEPGRPAGDGVDVELGARHDRERPPPQTRMKPGHDDVRTRATTHMRHGITGHSCDTRYVQIWSAAHRPLTLREI